MEVQNVMFLKQWREISLIKGKGMSMFLKQLIHIDSKMRNMVCNLSYHSII